MGDLGKRPGANDSKEEIYQEKLRKMQTSAFNTSNCFLIHTLSGVRLESVGMALCCVLCYTDGGSRRTQSSESRGKSESGHHQLEASGM